MFHKVELAAFFGLFSFLCVYYTVEKGGAVRLQEKYLLPWLRTVDKKKRGII